MKRKTKNENLAEEITHTIRTVYRDNMTGVSDDSLKGTVLSVLNLCNKPKYRPKKKDDSWKIMRDLCS